VKVLVPSRGLLGDAFQARATHEPSHVSLSRPLPVSVAIAAFCASWFAAHFIGWSAR
jgi:hypothetical protein